MRDPYQKSDPVVVLIIVVVAIAVIAVTYILFTS